MMINEPKQNCRRNIVACIVILLLIGTAFFLGKQWDCVKGAWNWFWCNREELATFATLIGFPIGVISLVFAFAQLGRTEDSAKAAESAANEALTRSKESYKKNTAMSSKTLIRLIKAHVDSKEWRIAASELDQLAEHLSWIAYSSDPPEESIMTLSKESRSFCQSFGNKNEGVKMATSQVAKWAEFLSVVEELVDGMSHE